MSIAKLKCSVDNSYDGFILMKVESAKLHFPENYKARLEYFNRLYSKSITTGKLSNKFKGQFNDFIKNYTGIISNYKEDEGND